MDRDRTLHPRHRELSQSETTQQPGPEEERSALLEAARGWADSAREASERLETDDARQFLETARRNGPGQ